MILAFGSDIFDAISFGQSTFSLLNDANTDGGKLELVIATLEQSHSKLVLKFLDGNRKCGLRHETTLSRMTKMALGSQCDKVA
jgi:hypothetical protein